MASCGEEQSSTRIRGARVHNLANLDVDIPRNKLVVITGPSGSGKSSLAFDTLYAEGQRQYIESLSVYARQFLDQLQRPNVDLIDGLQPTVCIDQRAGLQNPRSTVATVTEIYDYLRLLMARLGHARCFQCGQEIHQQSPEQIQRRIMELPEGTKAMIMSAMVRGRKGGHKDVLAKIRKAGLVRARVDGTVYDLDQIPPLEPRRVHHIDAVVDRVVIREGIRTRVGESVQLAIEHGDGIVIVCFFDDSNGEGIWRDHLYSAHYACTECNINYEELEPRTFSFNSPYGACPVCEGLGASTEFDPDLVIPDDRLSLADGAIAAWRTTTTTMSRAHLDQTLAFCTAQRIPVNEPVGDLMRDMRQRLLYGNERSFAGVLMLLEKEYATSTARSRLAQLETMRAELPCQACHASRLRPEAMNVFFAGQAIHELTALSVKDARTFFAEVELTGDEREVATPLMREINHRLEFLQRVGVEYLTLDRAADTLSGGELQRVRLATGIGSGLVGVCYILDEPSIGLHPRDNERLIDAICELKSLGNSILVVEHDEAIMRRADALIDMGPGAGQQGGRIIAQGTTDDVARTQQSVTGQYLAGNARIEVPERRRRTAKSRSVSIEKVSTNNLKDVSLQVPLQAFVCVTGVSGSGKSSLINETLAPALMRRLGLNAPKPGPHKSLRGVSQLDKVIRIDQMPIGRTPRSNPATYSGMFDEIRKVFANTREAKQRGYGMGRFSFNNKAGRCDVCQGHGEQKIEMSFMPDMYVVCDQCRGARFNRQTLQVHYRGKTIADVLAMSAEEAATFFENFASVQRTLECMCQVGLGYLPLGQPSTTLSGGEAQRIKLATELARIDTGKTLYLLDEPTTGLHFRDIQRLLDVLQKLVDKGNSVIVIEHNLDVIKCADWIIDLGPEGGANGGYIVASGRPEDLADAEDSYTGEFLRLVLNGHS